jgi:uncharacterized protein
MTDSALPALVQQMLEPGFYPHPVSEPIRLMQTHVSYVLLTGDFVYKLKKPVNFGFLDYDTLAKRKHFCEEELRLNQRGAGSLYLGVVPITAAAGKSESGPFTLNGTDEPAEYAVKMRQFPQSALLSEQFVQGQLEADKIRQLATVVAKFHAQSETSEHIRTYGTVEAIRQAFDENYAQTEGYVGGDAMERPQTQQQFDETKEYSDRFFTTQQALFQKRLDQDRIRACHGDLHLGNICEWENQLFLFDCIEFNEPFRFVDTMYDVAYIVMDLEVAGRSDLSTLFINQYVEETGDYEGLEILPLYVSRQSYVRAKVTSFMLGDASIPLAERQAASERAAKYYQLAWSYVQKKKGSLVAMAGLSGSGKSTNAQRLVEQSGAIRLRSDAIRKHLAGVPLHEAAGSEVYSAEMTDKTYSRLIALGAELAAQGYRVVLDAKFDRQAKRQEALDVAQTAAVPVTFVHCTAPADVLMARVTQRKGDIADATAAVLVKQSMEPFTVEPRVININTTQAEAEVRQQLQAAFELD